MDLLHQVVLTIAVLSVGAVFGIDLLCALVLRSAVRHVDDDVLTRVMGYVHFYGDRRLIWPALIGVVSTVVVAVLALVSRPAAVVLAEVAAALLTLVWLGVFLRVSAPVNKALSTAAVNGGRLPDARALQDRWDSVITARAVLLGLALLGLCVGAIAG